jgi:DnaJ-class molecular chaperone
MIIEKYIKKMTYCAFLGIEDGKINRKIIKQRYREKIREAHPDKNSHQKNQQEIVNAEERTKKINNARDWLLEDLDKRGS